MTGKTYNLLIPPTKAVDNGDGTYSISVAGSPTPLNGFSMGQWYGGTLNNILSGRYAPAVGEQLPQIDVDDYKDPIYPYVVAKEIGAVLYLYSRQFYKYPQLFVRATVPDRTGFPDNSHIGLEFEGVGLQHSLVAGFWFVNILGTTTVTGKYTLDYVHGEPRGVDLAAYLPADFMTALHRYACKVNKGSVEYRIDSALVLSVIYAPDSAFYSLAGPPYDIRIIPEISEPGGMFHIHLEDTNTVAVPGFSDGDPLPPRQYALYTENTNTKWTGLAPGAVVTSHPVPVWAYPRKTLVFQANAAGNLDIQVYVGGGWRSWVPGGITLVANQLEVYNLNGEVPIVRCVYTRVAAETITLAEWYLS